MSFASDILEKAFVQRATVTGRMCLIALTTAIVFAPSVHGQLVPVARKQAMTWGQPGGIPSNSLNELEELPAPTDSMTVDMATSIRQESNPWSGEASGFAPDESDQSSFGGLPTEIIRQRYPDGRVQIERYVTQDREGNFLNHGPWTLYARGGQVIARGQFLNGQMSGNWHRWHSSGGEGLFAEPPFTSFQGPFLSVCDFVSGEPSGLWTVMDARRRKILDIHYDEGRRDGLATWYWPNGIRMRQVEFSRGQLDGEMIEWDQGNRVTRRSSWDNNRELITRTGWFHRNQKRTEDHFLGPTIRFSGEDDWWNALPAPFEVDGEEIQHGPSSEWYPNGQVKMRGQFRDGSRAGAFVWWHDNGQRQTAGQYQEGDKQGEWNWWHANGALAVRGRYENDLAIGEWTWFEENGTLEHREVMDGQRSLEELQGGEGFSDAMETIDGTIDSATSRDSANDALPMTGDFGLSIPNETGSDRE